MSDNPDGIVHIKIAKELYFINQDTVKCQNILHQRDVLLFTSYAKESKKQHTSHKTN